MVVRRRHQPLIHTLLAICVVLGGSSLGMSQVGGTGVSPMPRVPVIPTWPTSRRQGRSLQDLPEPPLKPGVAAPSPDQDRPQVPPLPFDSGTLGILDEPLTAAGFPEVPQVQYSETQAAASPFPQFGEITMGYSWSHADTDHIYFGRQRQRLDEQVAQVRTISKIHTVTFEMGLCDRWSIVYELPFQYNSRRQQSGPISGGRIDGYFVTDTGDVADSRLILRKWLLDQNECVPLVCRPGNISFGAGVKLPTGREDKSTFFNGGDGGRDYFHDISVQTGTGSTDIFLAGAMYFEMGYFIPYAGFNWTITPDADNGVLAFHPQIADPNTTIVNSVTDSISWTVGFRYDLGTAILTGRFNDYCNCPVEPRIACDPCTCEERVPLFSLDRLKATFSFDGSHVPENDIFGHSPGFRRAFDALFLTPGIHYDLGSNSTLFCNVPLTVFRDIDTPGTFPHTQLNVGMSFNIR